MSEQPSLSPQITASLVDVITARLTGDRRVRRRLPSYGRVHIDRQLPFLVVYRRPENADDPGTARLVTNEAAYLTAPGDRAQHTDVARLVRGIAAAMRERFGAFLVVEVWAMPEGASTADVLAAPSFRVTTLKSAHPASTVAALERELTRLRIRRLNASVTVEHARKVAPPGMSALLRVDDLRELNAALVGVAVGPIYRDGDTGEVFPDILRMLRRELSRAYLRTFYEFARSETLFSPPHYHSLGRRAMVKAVWDVDSAFAEIEESFDFLLACTPVNALQAWRGFRRGKFEKAPVLHYRPQPVNPDLLKRRLWSITLERLEDPTIEALFRDKRDELDIQLTMLANLNTPRFHYGSMQLYGELGDSLIDAANALLSTISPRSRDDTSGGTLDAASFAERAEAEIAAYRAAFPALSAAVTTRDDIGGLMVSQGNVLIGRELNIAASRADALIQHEIGTHVLTYHNGRAQPFRQLYGGLAGYEELQEGLAVLAEYLVGGLSKPRLRLLAGRVIAAQSVIDGASFIDTFRLLKDTHRFPRYTAFTIAMRVHRGGGLTKDAVYLRGLVRLLAYLAKGGGLEPLFVGKIAEKHIPVIQELQRRGVLRPVPLRPRYLSLPGAAQRMMSVRGGLTVHDLIE